MTPPNRQNPPPPGRPRRLSASDVRDRLATRAHWRLDEDGAGISRAFEFEDFHRTMAFVNAVAWLAHRADHHPDMEVGFRRCRVRYSTHSAGGVTTLDFECAAAVDALVG